eukprot:15562055-Heterocapsa_arctica.AAC.1
MPLKLSGYPNVPIGRPQMWSLLALPPHSLPPNEDEGEAEGDDEDPAKVAHALKYYNINDQTLMTGWRTPTGYAVYS